MVQNKPQICYLLGAGASFHALPLVNELPYDLMTFKQYLIEYNKTLGDNRVIDFENKLSNFQNIINQTLQHHSIDTLARKYWLKQNNLKKQNKEIGYDWYQLIKNIIACWLTWRRLENLEPKFMQYDENSPKSERLKRVLKLDQRYDAFFSALLNDDLRLPENIKLVSWNYDLQIEQSFNFYLNKDTLKEVGDELGIAYFTQDVGQFVKLNGSAILSVNIDTLWETRYNEKVHEVFRMALSNEFAPSVFSDIRFAWESNLEDTNHGKIPLDRELASRYISESDIVVVIGYSFPIFNREIDKQLFANFLKKGDAKIYIQAAESEAEGIKSQLESLETGLSEKAEIIQNLTQFFIPNEYWSNVIPNIQGILDED
jgi:hypothetical protein